MFALQKADSKGADQPARIQNIGMGPNRLCQVPTCINHSDIVLFLNVEHHLFRTMYRNVVVFINELNEPCSCCH